MSVSGNFEQKWVDIVPPEMPMQSLDFVALVIVIAVLLVIFVLGIAIYNHPRQRAKRALHRLTRDLRRYPQEVKAVCFQVTRCLKTGFAQSRLQAIPWNPAYQSDWQNYLDRLTKCCFAEQPPSAAEADSIIQGALAWLNKNKAVKLDVADDA
jgi:hypothetical protein